jgi:hypothetical protein
VTIQWNNTVEYLFVVTVGYSHVTVTNMSDSELDLVASLQCRVADSNSCSSRTIMYDYTAQCRMHAVQDMKYER